MLVCPCSTRSDLVLALRSKKDNRFACGPYIFFSLSNAFAVTRIARKSRAHMNGQSPSHPAASFALKRRIGPAAYTVGPWCISRPANNCTSLPHCPRLPNAPSTSRTVLSFKMQMRQPPSQKKKCALSGVSSARPSRDFPLPCTCGHEPHQFLQLCVMAWIHTHATEPSAHAVGNTDFCIPDVAERWQHSAIPHFDTCTEAGFSFVRLFGSRRANVSYHPAYVASSRLLVCELTEHLFDRTRSSLSHFPRAYIVTTVLRTL